MTKLLKNSWRKKRPGTDPYLTTVCPKTGFVYHVRQVPRDPRKPFATAFCDVVGVHHETGSVYCAEIPGLVGAWIKAHTPLEEEVKNAS